MTNNEETRCYNDIVAENKRQAEEIIALRTTVANLRLAIRRSDEPGLKSVNADRMRTYQTTGEVVDVDVDKFGRFMFQEGSQFGLGVASIDKLRKAGINTDKPYTPPQTITIDASDMSKAAATIRANFSAEQITQLIGELR